MEKRREENVLSYSAKKCIFNALESQKKEIIKEINKLQNGLNGILRTPQKIEDDTISYLPESDSGIFKKRVDVLKKCLKKIIVAQIKLATDQYGICVVCGEPIPAARLEKVLFADKCVSCKELAAKGKPQREKIK